MICKRSLKLAKAIASRVVNVAPKRSRMANDRKFDAREIASPKLDVKGNRRGMANVVPKEIVHAKANGETVIVGRKATVHLKGKAVEARCLGSLNCSIRIKMAGSAATNSIG